MSLARLARVLARLYAVLVMGGAIASFVYNLSRVGTTVRGVSGPLDYEHMAVAAPAALVMAALGYAIWREKVWAMLVLPVIAAGAALYSLGSGVSAVQRAGIALAALAALLAGIAGIALLSYTQRGKGQGPDAGGPM